MKKEHEEILAKIVAYLSQPGHNSLRFGQALFNLSINEFESPKPEMNSLLVLRDIYNDSDEKILKRMKS